MDKASEVVKDYKKLVDLINAERKRIYENKQVPIDELRLMVFVSYACSEISIGKACEMLCLDIISFREQWNTWISTNPKMQKISEI